MDTSAIEFKILRDEQEGSTIIGFSMTACGESDAEAFCFSFPSAVNAEKADIFYDADKGAIVFIHKGVRPEKGVTNPHTYSDGGRYEASLPEEDAQALMHLLYCTGPYEGRKLKPSRILGFSTGFELHSVAA